MKSQQQRYNPVNQSDHDDFLEDPPVIVEVINPIEVNVRDEGAAADVDHSWNQAECAGCVGAVTGCLTGGLCLSVLCASGCIYSAKQYEEGTVAGDLARSCGNFGIQANKMIRDVNDRHDLTGKSKVAASTAWNKTKQLNEDYQIVDRTTNCLKSGVKAGIGFTKEHKLVERTTSTAKAIISTVAQEIGRSSINSSTTRNSATENTESEEVTTEAECQVVTTTTTNTNTK